MSGSGGDDVLRDFLVRLTYQVNAASQASFVRSLVESTTSSSQAASAMYRLGLAITEMAKTMAEAGDKLYWMSQRLQGSVQGIEAATFAMTQLGSSAGEASSAFEGLGSFVRQNGPGAINFLRSMGVTATDAGERMRQVGLALRAMGMRPGQEGTIGYARGLQYAQMLGINETGARAITADGYGKFEQESKNLRNQFGLNVTAMNAYAKSAMELTRVYHQFEAYFDTVWKRFAADLMPRLTVAFERLYLAMTNKNNINAIMADLKKLADAVVWVVDAFSGLVHLIESLDPLSKRMIEWFGGIMLAVKAFNMGLLTSPMFWFITMLTTLLLLIDDYNHWLKDPKTAAIDWSGFDKMKKAIDAFGEKHGDKDLFEHIVTALSLITGATMLLGLGKVAAAIRAIGTAATEAIGIEGAAAGAGALGVLGLVGLLALIGYAGSQSDPDDAKKRIHEIMHPDQPDALDRAWEWLHGAGEAMKRHPLQPSLWFGGGGGDGGGGDGMAGISTNVAPGGFMTASSGAKPSGQELMDYLTSAGGGGWSVTQAAGIIGNLMQESGLNPNASNDAGGGHYGMAQWGSDRQAAFRQKYGKPIQQATWREQIDFLNWELNASYERGAGDALHGASTLEGATMAMLSSERPGGWDTSPAELNRRLPYARAAAMVPGSVAGGSLGYPGGWQPGVSPVNTAPQGLSINQTTNISVAPGPTADDTARKVAGAQTRVNESLVRNTRAVVR